MHLPTYSKNINLISPQKTPINLSLLRKTQSVLFSEYQNKVAFKKIVFPAESLNLQLKIFEWRNTIQKSVVHCLLTCILPIDSNNVVVQTKRKYFPYTLKDINKISLTQLLYILREVLVGFEVLYNRFGGFQIQDDHIFIDENFQIQVWTSKQPSSNQIHINNQSQHQFLCCLLKLLKNHQIKSNIGIQFDSGLLRCDSLTFDMVKSYVNNFITRKQLIIGSDKSMKQYFMYPKSMKNLINNNLLKNVQKACSLNFIQFKQNNQLIGKNNYDLNLMFSGNKKMQRRRTNITPNSPSSVNFLKDSDMTTQETQDLSGSRQKSIFTDQKTKQKFLRLNDFDDKKCQQKIKKIQLDEIPYFQSNKNGKRKVNNQFGLKQDKKNSGYQLYFGSLTRTISSQQKFIQTNKEKIQNQKRQIYNLDLKFANKQNLLQSYTKATLSQRDDQQMMNSNTESIIEYRIVNENVNTNNPINYLVQRQETKRIYSNQAQISNKQKQFCQFSQQQSRPQIDLMLFKQKLKNNCKIFNTIDSIAQTKDMTNSIQMGQEKTRKKSPVKLQRLSKLKSKLYESIIEEQFFISHQHQHQQN